MQSVDGHCQSPSRAFLGSPDMPPEPIFAGFSVPHCGQESCFPKTMRRLLTQSPLGHCQSPDRPLGAAAVGRKPPQPPPPGGPAIVQNMPMPCGGAIGLSEPHCGHVRCFANTILRWFWHSMFGHCQSSARPPVTPPRNPPQPPPPPLPFVGPNMPMLGARASGLSMPHCGHAWCFPNTNFRLFMQSVFGHCQSPRPPGLEPPGK